MRELIEATLRGQPPVFVERCDLPGILAAIELYGISDVDGLRIVLNDAEQKADLRHAIGASAPPALLGAFLATNAIPLQQVCKTTERARLPPVTGKCKACKQGGELLACSFCTAVYHNTDACLGEAKVKEEPLVTSPSFLWACPGCFKKGVAAVQKAVLKPAGQKAAGAKKKRRKTK